MSQKKPDAVSYGNFEHEVEIRALSLGIGLGDIRPKSNRQISNWQASLKEEAKEAGSLERTQHPKISRVKEASLPRVQMQLRSGKISRWVMARILDQAIVAFILATVPLIGLLVFKVAYFKDNDQHQVLGQFWEILAKTSLLEIVAGFYGAYFLYWLLFRVLVGKTFGDAVTARDENEKRSIKQQLEKKGEQKIKKDVSIA